MSGKHLLGGNTLEEPHNLPNAVLWVKAYQHMDMVLVIPKLFNLQVVPLFNTFQGISQRRHDGRTQQSLAVLQRHYQVVVGVVDTVVAFGNWHTTSIAAYERNLRFPSYSPPPGEAPWQRPRGKGGIIVLIRKPV